MKKLLLILALITMSNFVIYADEQQGKIISEVYLSEDNVESGSITAEELTVMEMSISGLSFDFDWIRIDYIHEKITVMNQLTVESAEYGFGTLSATNMTKINNLKASYE